MTTTSIHRSISESSQELEVPGENWIRKAADLAKFKGLKAESINDPGLSKDEFLSMAKKLLDSSHG